MNTRVGKRQRRVVEAEAALVFHRSALRGHLHALGADARAAATPGRVVVGGFGLGALVGLLTGRRKHAPSPPAAAKPGMVGSLIGMVRLASMVMPMLGPLMSMAQGTAPGQATPAAAPEPAAATQDPFA